MQYQFNYDKFSFSFAEIIYVHITNTINPY